MSRGICCEQLVEIEDAGDLAAEVEQRGDELALARGSGVTGAAGVSSAGCPELTEACLPCAAGVSSRRKRIILVNSASAARHGCDLMDITLPLDYTAIERILPHRYPFLLVDRITELEPDKRIVGIKNVTLNERYLAHRHGRARRCCRRPC